MIGEAPFAQVPGDDTTEPTGDETVAVNRATAALAAGLSAAGAAWMVSSMFRDFSAHLVALGGAVLGTGIVLLSFRIRRGTWLQYTLVPAAVLVALVLVAPDARGGSSGFVQLVVDAVRNGGLLQPPIPFDPGWRAILVVVFALLAGASAALAAGLRRPKVGVVIPLPIAIGAGILQPPSTEVVSAVVTLVLVVVALTLATGAALGGGPERSAGFEVRRMIRGGVIATGLAALVIGISSFGFLFPQPNQERVVPPQRPQLPPPEPDRVLFSYFASRPVPLRLGTIDVYDVGQKAWLLPPYDPARVQRLNLPASIKPAAGLKYKPGAGDVKVTVTIADATGHALPDVADLVKVQGHGSIFGYDPRTGALTLADKPVFRGLRYTVEGAPLPDGTELATAPKADKSFQAYLTAPPAPAQVSALLTQYSERSVQQGVAEDQWNRLQFLRQALYSKVVASGAGRPVDLPPSRVAQILDGGEASPYEIVAAEALLARWAGVPSRLGFGYYGGDRQADGRYDVHPVHGAMWVEVYYSGHGWLPVVGVPPKAKPSTSQAQKNQVNIPSTNLGQLIVYIPVRNPTLLPLFEVVRWWLARVVPVLVLVLALITCYPWAVKAVRTRRRRAWARRHGLRGRIAVAYAEYRDLARDLTIGDPAATVGRRLDKAQGGLTRVLGRVARTSLREPYTEDVPNVWWEPTLRIDLGVDRRFRARRRTRARQRALALAAGVIAMLMASCATAAAPHERAISSGLVPEKLGDFSFKYEPGPSQQYRTAGADALVSNGKVFSIHQADATDGALEMAVFKPDVDVTDINDESLIRHCFESPEECPGHEVVLGLEKNLGSGHFQRMYYHDQRAYRVELADQRIYLWFPPNTESMMMLILLGQFNASGGDAMFHALLDYQHGRPVGAIPVPSITPGGLAPFVPNAAPGGEVQLPAGLLPSPPVILFGRPAASPSPPPPPQLNLNPFPNFPLPLEQAPPLVALPLPSPSPIVCPVASQLSFPELDARPTPEHVPTPGIYPYRYATVKTLNPGTPTEKTTTTVGVGTREVTQAQVNTTDNSYTFSVIETFNGIKTTNTYKVYPFGPAPVIPGAPVSPAAGLYLQEQLQESSAGKDDFVPQPPVLLMPFPASKGNSFQGGGTDPINGPTTMAIDPNGGTVVDKARVDACGSVLDSWQVDINGHVVNPRGGGPAITFSLTLFIGTQYGAVSLGDHLVSTGGTDPTTGQPMKYEVTAIINVQPPTPR